MRAVAARCDVARRAHRARAEGWGRGRKAIRQEWGRRTDGQRVRPSSKASREAAASSTPSVGSHPPLGTAKSCVAWRAGWGMEKMSVPLRHQDRGRGVLTDPVIWPFPAGNDEDLARCSCYRNRTADDARCRAALITHGEDRGEQRINRGGGGGGGRVECASG